MEHLFTLMVQDMKVKKWLWYKLLNFRKTDVHCMATLKIDRHATFGLTTALLQWYENIRLQKSVSCSYNGISVFRKKC